MEAVLTPRYDNMQVYHYRGGNTQVLEDELVQFNPPHDDVKDALTTAIEHAVKPAQSFRKTSSDSKVVYHPRFGGRAF